MSEKKTTATPAVPRRVTRPPVAQHRCDAFGLEAVCERLAGGDSLTAIAREIGVGLSSLLTWCEADAERSARVRATRELTGRIWDERAERCLLEAGDPFELSRAKELAHHYRWRAKVLAPRDYGDRVTQEITGAGGGPLQLAAVDLRGLSDVELEQMQRLVQKAADSGASGEGVA